ncbi:hypothetical protein M569_08422, partial [Genlisea aurea]
RQGFSSWIGVLTPDNEVEIYGDEMKEEKRFDEGDSASNLTVSDADLSYWERAVSAAGAAFTSAIIVNPLDVAKTRLQAQAAGVLYDGVCLAGCSATTTDFIRTPFHSNGQPTCSPDCTRYKGTLDVLCKVVRQEGFSRLWRGTNASLALAIPSVGIYMPLYDIFRNYMEELTLQGAPSVTPYVPIVAGSLARSVACVSCYPVELARTRMQASQHGKVGVKPPGVLETLIGVMSPHSSRGYQSYRSLFTGLGAQLARDVPFSAVCWSSLEPLRRKMLYSMGDESSAAGIITANFSAGFVAGSLAAAATCPLDVARTRRQIEVNP